MPDNPARPLHLPDTAVVASYKWIQSPLYDLSCFILSPLLGVFILLVAPSGPSILAILAGTMLGIPHYFSTFTFYCWDENRPYHRARWLAFFVGPCLILLAFATVVMYRIPYIIQATIYFWNTYHVSRQSCGILSIYRHRAGVFEPRLKTLTNVAIIATNGSLAFWNIAWYPTLHQFLSLLNPALPLVLWLSLSAVAVVALARLGMSLWRRRQTAQAPQLPEMCFLATSLLLFHPYLWIHDANRATLGMLIGHFVQYLGIVWLLNRRKFTVPTGSRAQRWLGRLSGNVVLLLLVLLAAGMVFLGLQLLSERGRILLYAYEAMYLSLALIHFYLDGLFWAFKQPQIRHSMAPFLMAGPAGVVARS